MWVIAFISPQRHGAPPWNLFWCHVIHCWLGGHRCFDLNSSPFAVLCKSYIIYLSAKRERRSEVGGGGGRNFRGFLRNSATTNPLEVRPWSSGADRFFFFFLISRRKCTSHNFLSAPSVWLAVPSCSSYIQNQRIPHSPASVSGLLSKLLLVIAVNIPARNPLRPPLCRVQKTLPAPLLTFSTCINF